MHTRSVSQPVWLVFAVILALGIPAAAQTDFGTISGTVVDSSTAAIVGANLTLRSDTTGDTRTVTTGARGDFQFLSVLPGRYTLVVEMQGFKRLEKQQINLTASERLSVGDLALDVGAVTDSVTVTAEGTPVQTTSQERSAVITIEQLSDLANRGRDFTSLLRVVPGSVDTGSLPSVNGMRPQFVSLAFDGLSQNDMGSPEFGSGSLSMESIAEVKVFASNYQAEYGRNGGAMVNAITKSGARGFHGSGLWYKQHEQFNANSFFNNRNSTAKGRNRLNTYGGSIGGPVYIPHLFNQGRNKLFFFFSEEKPVSKSTPSPQRVTVPTQIERNGDFSQTYQTNGTTKVIVKDPANGGLQFPNNVIPTSRIDLNGQKLLQGFPLPNFFDRATSLGAYNYVMQETVTGPKHFEVARIDYNATDALKLFLKGTQFSTDAVGYAVSAPSATWGMLKQHYLTWTRNLALGSTWSASSTMVNEFTFGVHYLWEDGHPADPAELATRTRAGTGMTLPQFYPANNPTNLIPWASFGGITGAAGYSTDNRFPLRGSDTLFSVNDAFTKIWNTHTVKAGVNIEVLRNYEGERGTFAGSFSFAGNQPQNPLDTGWAYSNAMLGVFTSYAESTSRPGTYARAQQYDSFIQDNWKVTRKLTLDYGMRFTWYTPIYQAKDAAAEFALSAWDPSKKAVLYVPALDASKARVAKNPVSGELLPAVYIGAIVPNVGSNINGMVTESNKAYPPGFVNNRGLHFGPRIGFAYDLTGDGKTAIRSGFGTFYNTRPRGWTVGDMATNPPIQFTPTLYYGTLSTFINSSGVLFPSSVVGADPNGKTPTVYNFSFAIQRAVGFGTVVEAAYVGSLSRHLNARKNINQIPYGTLFLPSSIDTTNNLALPTNFLRPYPGYGNISISENNLTSNYNSLQVQANRRFTKGLEFGAFWTWSKAMTYGEADGGSIPSYAPLRVWSYGKGSWDRTHNLTVNFLWQVPRGSRVANHVVTRFVADNWKLSGIATFISGSPAGISCSTSYTLEVSGGGDGYRCLVLGNAIIPKNQRNINHFFDTTQFKMPPVGNPGNAPKDVLRGPGTNNWDMTLFKVFPAVKERFKFQVRFEAYNAFNHTQFSGINTSAQFDQTGAQINPSFGTITSARSPRLMQAALRVDF